MHFGPTTISYPFVYSVVQCERLKIIYFCQGGGSKGDQPHGTNSKPQIYRDYSIKRPS